jgi:hypothetical protein
VTSAHVLAAVLAAAAVQPASAAERDARHPEILWQRAAEFREAGALDPSQYKACAEHFEAVARQLGPEHPRAGEAMYQAARCHEASGAVGPALLIDELLAEKHRDATLGRLALAAVGRERLALLQFARAADAFEGYADRYAADKHAPGLLVDAAELRSRLGMYEQAKRDLEQIDRLFSRSAPMIAAEAFWARPELLPVSYANDKARRAHAEEFLKLYGDAGGETRKLLAIARLGEIDWRASCKQKQPGPLGLCVELRRDQPTLCDAKVTRVIVYPRDRKLEGAAVAAFERVLAATRRMDPHDLFYEGELSDAASMAKVRLADRDLEAFLGVHMPEDLSFTVEEWRRDSSAAGDRARYEKQIRKRDDSTRRFQEFYSEKTKLAGALQKKYESVFNAQQSGAGMFAAAARASLMSLAYADEVMQSNVDLPPGPDPRQALCEQLEERLAPHISYAMTVLSGCLVRARRSGEFDESARFCEDELQRRMPLAFPPLRELFAEMQALDPGEPETIGVQVEPYGFGEQ